MVFCCDAGASPVFVRTGGMQLRLRSRGGGLCKTATLLEVDFMKGLGGRPRGLGLLAVEEEGAREREGKSQQGMLLITKYAMEIRTNRAS
jgi:hypothetical protein